MKNDITTKENKEISHYKNPKNKITHKHLTNLDNFIQQSLDKFKFIDPKQEFYDATGDEKDLIISHKSTIPDLVIWNKNFNKNECFEEANTKKGNPFPRLQFYLRIKSNKPDKNKKKEKKNDKEKDKDKEKNNQNKKNNKEGKNKNKKKQENKSNNNNNNVLTNNSNNNEINVSMNNISKIEKKISDLSEIDINSIKEFKPRHKNNIFSSNKDIMNFNVSNNSLLFSDTNSFNKSLNLKDLGIIDNKSQEITFPNPYSQEFHNISQAMNLNGNFINSKSSDIIGNNDINITINNNNFFQQVHLNNNNNNINNNNLNYNIDNSFIENKMKENPIFNLIAVYSETKGWLLIDSNNGQLLNRFNSSELYFYLSQNRNLMNFVVLDIKQQYKIPGNNMFNFLSQFYNFNLNNNQIQLNQFDLMKQQMNYNNNIPNINNTINMNPNINQINNNNNIITEKNLYNNSGFNLNNNNKINMNLNNRQDFIDNNTNNINYFLQNISLNDYNKNNHSNKPGNDIVGQNLNNIFNLNNNNVNDNNNDNKSNENDLFRIDNFFNPQGLSLFTQNQTQNINQNKEQNLNINNNFSNISLKEKNDNNLNNNINYIINNNNFIDNNNNNNNNINGTIANETNIIEIDDKTDNDDYKTFENLIFNRNNNKNSNSKSKIENIEENNNNENSQFETNIDYQTDNYDFFKIFK